jgi:hypothetical protein
MSDRQSDSKPPQPTSDTSKPDGTNTDAALSRIGSALKGLRYGSVLAIVQDGVVVQIERTEKTRLDKLGR